MEMPFFSNLFRKEKKKLPYNHHAKKHHPLKIPLFHWFFESPARHSSSWTSIPFWLCFNFPKICWSRQRKRWCKKEPKHWVGMILILIWFDFEKNKKRLFFYATFGMCKRKIMITTHRNCIQDQKNYEFKFDFQFDRNFKCNCLLFFFLVICSNEVKKV